MARTAAEAVAGVGALTEEINAAIVRGVPSLGRDVDVRQEVDLSTRANVETILRLLANPSLPVDGSAPTEALQLVGTLLRRGIDPQDLIQAYRIGQNSFWRWWMQRLARAAAPGPALVEALDESSALLFARIDFLVDAVLREWDGERELWLGGTLARRSEVVHELLFGDPPSVADASRDLDYDLDRVLTAGVLWHDGAADGDALQRLDVVAAGLASAAGADRPLTLPVGTAALWVWLGTPDVPDIDRIAGAARGLAADGVGIALGTPVRRGFRQSHLEAMCARRVAELAVDQVPVASYAELEVVSLLTADLDRLVPFVQRTIGGLGVDGDGPARLRATVSAWLKEGGNARRAAVSLGLHKNTVLYRLQRAEELRGRKLTHERLALELALDVVAVLGTASFAGTPETVRADG